MLLKSSFFYDLTYVNYNVSYQANKQQVKRTHQIGNETAFLVGDTRIGLGIRNVAYKRESSTAIENVPQEQTLNLQATHTFKRGDFKFEPTLGGTAITRIGFHPYFSAGLRHETDSDGVRLGQFLRLGFHTRFPSLLDRYYEFVQAAGPSTLVALPNPGLKPEDVRSVETGADYSVGNYHTQLIGFLRDYKHARYTSATTIGATTYYQIQNAGDAYVFGFTHSQDYRMSPNIDFGTRLTYQQSKIKDLDAEFPYSPKWVGILKLDLHDSENRFGVEIVEKAATEFLSYSESSSSPSSLPNYKYTDLFARARVIADVTLVAGIEDLFDKKIQYQSLIPAEGRVYSLSATANF